MWDVLDGEAVCELASLVPSINGQSIRKWMEQASSSIFPSLLLAGDFTKTSSRRRQSRLFKQVLDHCSWLLWPPAEHHQSVVHSPLQPPPAVQQVADDSHS